MTPYHPNFKYSIVIITQNKAKIKQKRLFRQLKNEDAKKKREIEELIYSLPDKLIENMIDCNDFVFSLTSYSYRVADSLPYTLYSIITQTIKPKKIVVYLDNVNISSITEDIMYGDTKYMTEEKIEAPFLRETYRP